LYIKKKLYLCTRKAVHTEKCVVQRLVFYLKWIKNENFLHENLYMLENFYTFASD